MVLKIMQQNGHSCPPLTHGNEQGRYAHIQHPIPLLLSTTIMQYSSIILSLSCNNFHKVLSRTSVSHNSFHLIFFDVRSSLWTLDPVQRQTPQEITLPTMENWEGFGELVWQDSLKASTHITLVLPAVQDLTRGRGQGQCTAACGWHHLLH